MLSSKCRPLCNVHRVNALLCPHSGPPSLCRPTAISSLVIGKSYISNEQSVIHTVGLFSTKTGILGRIAYTQYISAMRPIATDVARSMVCVYVRTGHTNVLCKNGWTDWDAVWGLTLLSPGNHVLDGVKIESICSRQVWKIGDAAFFQITLDSLVHRCFNKFKYCYLYKFSVVDSMITAHIIWAVIMIMYHVT